MESYSCANDVFGAAKMTEKPDGEFVKVESLLAWLHESISNHVVAPRLAIRTLIQELQK
jgi:hypothetical protein